MLKDEEIAQLIYDEFNSIRDFVLEKNKKYKNSVFEPARLFSRSSPVEQILVRIDDKLSRIKNFEEDYNSDQFSESFDDVVKDLVGYLTLLRIVKKLYSSETINKTF